MSVLTFIMGENTLLSRIREYLAHSSPALREMFGLVAQWLPPKLRYGKDFVVTAGEIARAQESPEDAHKSQLEMLKAVLLRAREVAAYQSDPRYATLDSPIEDPADTLTGLPILYKEDFRGRPEEFLATDLDSVDKVTTSGSSGEPAVFYLNRRRAASEWAYVCHAWRESGYKPGDWRAVIRGVHLGGRPPRKWRISRATSELMLSAMGLDEATSARYWELVKKHRIHYVHGYPSAIYSLAMAAQADEDDFRLRVRGIFPVSEGTLSHQEVLIKATFPNAAFLPSYGLSERVAMAHYHPSEDTYEFYPLYGYVELLDDEDRPIAVGERGRIVATGLRLTAMPLLRYDTGDTAELVGISNSCIMVRDIRGRRAQEQLITESGASVSIAALNLHSAIHEKIFAFRIRQFEAGKAEVIAVPARDATFEDVQDFAKELQRSCLSQIKFTASMVGALPPTSNAKIRLVEQHILSAVIQ